MLPKGLLKEYSHILVWLMRGIDAAVLMFAGIITYQYRFHEFPSWIYLQALLIAALISLPVFSLCGMYRSFRRDNFFQVIGVIFQSVAWLALILSAIAFIAKIGPIYSRIWFLLWIAAAIISLIILRSCLFCGLRWMRIYGFNERQVVIIGSGELVKQMIERVQQSLWTGLRVIAVLDEGTQSNAYGSIPVYSMPEDLSQWLEKSRADECWIALSLPATSRIQEILFALRHSMITTRCVLDFQSMDLLNYSVSEINGMPVFTLRGSPMVGINRFIKACEDRFLAFCILILISPIFLTIALLIKCTSKGPIFYRQARMGWNGVEFDMLKFRTMPVDSENKTGPVWATAGDARPTFLGKWLRRTSLDELPQFINVLKGDMSIVGPRPERKVFVDQFKQHVPRYMQKHYVKAGITGWAQVNGWRGNTSLEKRIECDLYYIEHWSLWFDLKIILLTIVRGFIHPNAY